MDDTTLGLCNETELLELARRQGMGRLRRGIPHERLVALISGAELLALEDKAPTVYTRAVLEDFIQANFERARTQLPGCDGHCSTFACTEGRHARCFLPKAKVVQL